MSTTAMELRLRCVRWERVYRKLIAGVAVLTLAWSATSQRAQAQRDLRDIPPPDPQVELASFAVADGFEVNLFAADPLLAKPTQISFDRRGRLWVSSSETYPQLVVNQEPTDRIVILEDRDRDGQAEISEVFYDQLIIPGGVLPDGEGGAYVAHAEELLHLQDKDQDGRADRTRVLLSGFGTEDTHHTLHRLKWGPDGLLYMLQGYYIGTHVETLYGPRRLNGGGLWSYDTRTRRLEIYSRGLVNPWGMAFDRWGQTFQTDGAGGEGINFSFPDSVFRASPHENRILRGLNPGRPKSCGLEIISGRHMPEEWRGSLLTSDFRANNIDRYLVTEQGSGFLSKLQADVLRSTHVSFRPIDMVMGPDGAIYVADWYSPIIQHGEVDFRDKRRDQVHGRIWRIAAKGRPLTSRIDYQAATIWQLLELLKADEDWVRLNAKQELKLRDESHVETEINRWLESLDADDPNFEHHRLEALWAYQTTTTKRSRDLARRLLTSPDHRVRAAATRVLYHWHDRTETFAPLVRDPHPHVRREAVSALGQLQSSDAARIALAALDLPRDEFLDFALWRTCRRLQAYWLPVFQQGDRVFDNADHLAFALKAVERPDALAPLLELLGDSSNIGDPELVRLVGKIGTADDLNILLRMAGKAETASLPAALALVEAGADRQIWPNNRDALVSVCHRLLQASSDELVSAGCRLAGLWKLSSFAEQLGGLIVNADDIRVRDAAAKGLGSLGDVERLTQLSRDGNIETRVAAASTLARVDAVAGSQAIVALLERPLQEADLERLISALVVKRKAAALLAQHLQGRSIPRTNALVASRLVETSRDGLPKLVQAFAKAGGIRTVPQHVQPRLLQRWLDALDDRDPLRGKKIFQRVDLTCVKCHAVQGQGGTIGPDLSSIGTAAPADYLIESILAPSQKIKEGYRMAVIQTTDGDVVSGLVAQEDERVVVVRNSVGVEFRVPKPTIESRATSPISMMPSGLTASLREDEFLDLIAYLTSLGKQE